MSLLQQHQQQSRPKLIQSTMHNLRQRRTMYDLLYDLLIVAHEFDTFGLPKNKLIVKSGLGGSQCQFIDILIKMNLLTQKISAHKKKPNFHIRDDVIFYVITKKGLEFIQRYKSMTELLVMEDK